MANVKNYNFITTEKLQRYVGVFLFVAITILLSSCSANKYSQSEINMYLTKKRAKAKTSQISFRIPQGWHVVDANNKVFIDLWIVRNDMNVSLSLQPFHINSTFNSLEQSFKSSILLRQSEFKNTIKIVKEEPLQLNNSKVLIYNYTINKKEYRVALFQHKEKFYELTLFGKNRNIKIEYFIQELVISSAK